MARTPAPAKDEDKGKPPPDPKDDDTGDGDDDLDDDDAGDITRGDLEDLVRKIVAETGKPAPKDDDDDKGAPKGKRTAGDVEDEVRRRTETEVARVREKDEIVGRLAKVEEAVKPVEQAPTKVRRLTKAIWG